MNLMYLFEQQQSPQSLWDGKYKIPWDESNFSARMLKEHLSQEHDLASRRLAQVEDHVGWIVRELIDREPSRILDLACGPGLYSHRLATLGHTCRGIDFSPASIAYAAEHATNPDRCEFVLGDLRTTDFGEDYDLALFIYGEFNAFPENEAARILSRACAALRPGGRILIEAHTPETIERIGRSGNSWYQAESGLFSERPHICLISNQWHEAERAAAADFFVVDAADGTVTPYRNTLLQYSLDDYRALLEQAGFSAVEILPPFGETASKSDDTFLLLTARV